MPPSDLFSEFVGLLGIPGAVDLTLMEDATGFDTPAS
jgi:hypothetical protein